MLKKHISEGHRKRLRERFLNSGLDGFLDYEIIELLLTLGTPRKDCKQQAKEAILKFNGLSGVFNATTDELQLIKGIGPANAFGIRLFKSLAETYSKNQLKEGKNLNSPAKIYEYLRGKIGNEKKEYFVVLFFDTRHKLIVDETSIGILNASLIHPREVFNSAIINHASHIIIAHNHPSGDPKPSEEDIQTTNRLVDAGKILGIEIVDHIIVTKSNYFSLKENDLLLK